MANLPDPLQLERQAVRPSTTVAGYTAGQEAEGLAAIGQSTAGAGIVLRMQMHHQDNLDTQAAKGAELELREKIMVKLSEHAKLKGINAYSGNVMNDLQTGFNTERDNLAQGLSPGAQAKYLLAAKGRGLEMTGAAMNHSMAEEETHKNFLYTKGLDVIRQEATADFGTPGKVVGKLEEMREEISKRGEALGWGDKDMVDQGYREEAGKLWTTVVQAQVQAGDLGGATANITLGVERGELTTDAATTLRKLVEPEIDATEGKALAGVAFQSHLKNVSEVEILEDIRRNSLTNGAYQQAVTQYHHLKAAKLDGEHQSADTLVSKYMQGDAGVVRSQEFVKLEQDNPDLALKVRQSINVMDNSKGRDGKFPESTEAQLRVMYDLIAKGASKGAIILASPELGPKATHFLLKQEAERIRNEGNEIETNRQKFVIPSELVGLSYNPHDNTGQKIAKQGAIAMKLAEWLDINPGLPDREQQLDIVRSIREKHNVHGEPGFFGNGPWNQDEFWKIPKMTPTDIPMSEKQYVPYPVSFGDRFPSTTNKFEISQMYEDFPDWKREMETKHKVMYQEDAEKVAKHNASEPDPKKKQYLAPFVPKVWDWNERYKYWAREDEKKRSEAFDAKRKEDIPDNVRNVKKMWTGDDGSKKKDQ